MSRMEAWRNMATVLGHWQLRGFGLWAVEEREQRGARGPGGLLASRGMAGPGAGLDSAAGVLGRGICDRGGTTALDVAFGHLGQPHVISMIDRENEPSIRVAQRLRMRLEGRTELLGHPVVVYGIRRSASRVS